jgi:membrane protease YdiL (CAAX protease family)
MLFFLRRGLLWPRGMTLTEAFGLRLHAGGRALVLVSLMLIGLEQGLGLALSALFDAAGFKGHWVESIHEPLLDAAPVEAAMIGMDGVVWAPLFEEIACRGMIYTTLRARFAPWPAATGSAALFAVPHLYSLPATLVLFAGAVIAALVYERTRSLWPAILAHAVNNAFAFGGTALIYR